MENLEIGDTVENCVYYGKVVDKSWSLTKKAWLYDIQLLDRASGKELSTLYYCEGKGWKKL